MHLYTSKWSHTQQSVPKTVDLTSHIAKNIKHTQINPNDIPTNELYAEFRCESNGTSQSVSNPTYDKNKYVKNEVGGRSLCVI